jgi:hypothetical protein
MTTQYNAGLDSSDVKVSYAVEAVWATIPTTVFKQLRITAEDFTESKTRTRPLEINPSGYAQHAITTKVEAKGSLNFGLSFATFDDFLLGALNAASWSNFGSLVGAAGVISAVAAGNEFSDTGTGAFAQFVPGQKIRVSGFTNAQNNGIFKVVSVTAGPPSIMVVVATSGTVGGGILVNEAPAGSITIEAYSLVEVGGDISITTGTNVLGSTTANKFANVVAGQWLQLTGFTNAANNGAFLVASKTDSTHLVLENATNTQAFVTETPAAAAVSIFGNFVQNSNVVTTFSFEKQMAANLFLQYVGSYVSSLQLTMQVGKFVEGVLSFLVKGQTSAVVEGGTATPYAANVNRIIDNIGGFSAFNVNGAAPTAVLQSVELTISKQRSASQYGIGSANAVGMRRGTLQVDGKLSLFFKDFTYFNDFVNETDLGVSWQLTDNNGNAYVITLPSISIMNPSIVAKGIDQDMVADFALEANPAPATNALYPAVTIQLDRLFVS